MSNTQFQPQRTKRRGRAEEAEQSALVRWSHRPVVQEKLPELRWLHHSPNGGQRNKVTGAQMKALGTKPGWPDLVLPVARDEYAGLAIEMKSARGRLTAEQEAWLAHFEAQGWLVLVVRAAEQARRLVCSYLGASADALPGLDVSQKAGAE